MTENTPGGSAASEGAPEKSPETASKKTPSTPVSTSRAWRCAPRRSRHARGDAAQQKKQARRGDLRSGARADGRDPMALGAAINRLLTERGWETPAAVGGVMGRWPQIVGEDLAKHCVPLKYDDDPAERVLTVQCDSTAWATQLRLLAPQVVARLNQDLGHGTVRLIKVQGPMVPRAASACVPLEARVPATPTGDRGHIERPLRGSARGCEHRPDSAVAKG